MNTLTEKAKHNLKHLFEMGENDTFNSERGKLVPQEDFVQVNNTVDLEYTIYFTFHHYISSNDMNSFYDDNIIKKLDTCIDNLYDNKQFNQLINDDDYDFQQIIDDIDNKLTNLKDRYYYQSPFYIFFKKYHTFYNFCKNILNENNIYIHRILNVTNRDIHREYYEEEESEQSGEEEEGQGHSGEVEQAEQSGEEEEEKGEETEEEQVDEKGGKEE
tara:strand:- start:1853 stop:2500 length:648 start_codon:yes stop_codon:yes gene_type:complete